VAASRQATNGNHQRGLQELDDRNSDDDGIWMISGEISIDFFRTSTLIFLNANVQGMKELKNTEEGISPIHSAFIFKTLTMLPLTPIWVEIDS
jgi:hypothetical protein